MKTRQLGGMKIGEMGLGCWQLGGDWGQKIDEERAFAIMAAAVEQGVSFFDTADVYGKGRSEELIGRFLQTCDTAITVATKFGRDAQVFPDHYTEGALRQSVDASLKRLGVDALDLLQLHCIPTPVLQEGSVFRWLRSLQQEGLIKHFGASAEGVEQALICLEQEGLVSLQVIFNVFRQNLITELLPQAQARGVGIIVRLPLASGLLSGKFSQDTRFRATDHRRYNRDGKYFHVGETFAGLPFAKGVELAQALGEHVPSGMSMAQMALRWILDHDAVSVVIPGASSPEQVRGNAEASELASLSQTLAQRLAEFYDQQVREHIRGPQ